MLLGLLHILQIDGKDTLLGGVSRRTEQGMKHRIAIEPGQAAPDHMRALVDQRGDAAVANQAEIEISHVVPAIRRSLPCGQAMQ